MKQRIGQLFAAALLLSSLSSSAFAQGNGPSGRPDTAKPAASWFGACIFLIVAATILRSFFL